MKKNIQTRQQGFTLIEIAIVLVIIGLLLGGVLKGQEMITNAKIKRLENDFNGVTAAIYSYQDRYQALPGDDAAAAGRWADVTTSGNGNSAISSTDWDTGTTTSESRLFWQHLRASGLIAGAATSSALPTNAYNGQIGVQNTGMSMTGLIVCMSGIPGPIAEILDLRLDDGDATSGVVRGDTNPALGTDTDPYTETGTFVMCKKA